MRAGDRVYTGASTRVPELRAAVRVFALAAVVGPGGPVCRVRAGVVGGPSVATPGGKMRRKAVGAAPRPCRLTRGRRFRRRRMRGAGLAPATRRTLAGPSGSLKAGCDLSAWLAHAQYGLRPHNRLFRGKDDAAALRRRCKRNETLFVEAFIR